MLASRPLASIGPAEGPVSETGPGKGEVTLRLSGPHSGLYRRVDGEVLCGQGPSEDCLETFFELLRVFGGPVTTGVLLQAQPESVAGNSDPTGGHGRVSVTSALG
ncbi:hypothetical protein PG999_010552 [Apiospora kogelbergensis]|uniref:Uncharacterized protein n=1 Tax=Apiospora kogelbergensis TaxID=1337665 RepID=A0AAW0QG48_9PEZI